MTEWPAPGDGTGERHRPARRGAAGTTGTRPPPAGEGIFHF